jgi:hypothetical protein
VQHPVEPRDMNDLDHFRWCVRKMNFDPLPEYAVG